MSELAHLQHYGLPIPGGHEAAELRPLMEFEGEVPPSPADNMEFMQTVEDVKLHWPPLQSVYLLNERAQHETQAHLTPGEYEEYQRGLEHGHDFALAFIVYLNWRRSDVADWQTYLRQAPLLGEFPMIGSAQLLRVERLLTGTSDDLLDIERESTFESEDATTIIATNRGADVLYRYGFEFMLASGWFQTYINWEERAIMAWYMPEVEDENDPSTNEREEAERVEIFSAGFRRGALVMAGVFIDSWQTAQLEKLEEAYEMPAAEH